MVDGTTPKPLSLDAIGHVAWVKKESQAVRHKEQQSHESIHHIQQYFFDIIMEDESIVDFFEKIKEARSELTNLDNNTFIVTLSWPTF